MPITLTPDKTFTQLLQKNLAERFEKRRRQDDLVVHVSDILPQSCLRKQYYSRKYPELDPLTNESVHHFARGLASEHIITKLAGIGAAQVPVINSDVGVQGHPDIFVVKKQQQQQQQQEPSLTSEDKQDEIAIMTTLPNDTDVQLSKKKNILNDKEPVIIELKDSVSGERLDFNNITFRSYLSQLLYYMALTDVEKGILSINYNVKELNWIKRDDQGDHYVRPFDAKPVGIESWSVVLPYKDLARDLIKDQIAERRDRFLKALQNNEVKSLPRLTGELKRLKCKGCCYRDKCFNEDLETLDAKNWSYKQQQDEPLNMSGIVNLVSQM